MEEKENTPFTLHLAEGKTDEISYWEENRMLHDYCRWQNYNLVKKLLKNNSNVDILYDNGSCLSLAIANSSTSILEALIKYYKKNKLSGDRESYTYKEARFRLFSTLEDIIEDCYLTEEIATLLKDYMPTEHNLGKKTLREKGYTTANDVKGDYEELLEAIKQGNNILVKEILDKSPQLARKRDQYGQTPLHWASGSSNAVAVVMLLDMLDDRDICQESYEGDSALDLASTHEIYQLLEIGATQNYDLQSP